MDYEPAPNIETTLPGLTLTAARQVDNDRIELEAGDRSFALYHNQDCCESVVVDAIRGKLESLVGSPLTEVKETIESGEGGSLGESWTKTTYVLATKKARVTIYWVGSSNGYYSESVSLVETTNARE